MYIYILEGIRDIQAQGAQGAQGLRGIGPWLLGQFRGFGGIGPWLLGQFRGVRGDWAFVFLGFQKSKKGSNRLGFFFLGINRLIFFLIPGKSIGPKIGLFREFMLHAI